MIPENTVIQTVPSRSIMIPSLVERLKGLNPYVSTDPDYLGTHWHLTKIMKENRDGVLIIQDDVIIPTWFREELDKAMVPDRCMIFLIGLTDKQRQLYDEGFCYAETQRLWCPANYYTGKFIEEYLEWATDENLYQPEKGRITRADDYGLQKFLKQTGKSFLLTLPNLCNHNNQIPSTLGHPKSIKGKARVSSLFSKDLLRRWDHAKIGKL